ncbi:hypothetical protein SASPL_147269 [Salvia splendens]|uniref:Reverse transcriptase Ty1/copia-type domain-containing protein n=1 Tax=Salvia splendens TaxID=180675 RepID=A0A8X8WF81_SALSN|nr:hypothetical protein SASPL_147269 [Salvia splendens]
MVTQAKRGIFKPKTLAATTSSSDKIEVHLLIPCSAKFALVIPVWRCAMTEEFLALLKNKTWILTYLPPGKNLIGCTWVFHLKKHADGSIARHKASLVAQGFSQEAGLDFLETFSPVVKPNTIRLILSIAVTSGWSIKHLDVNNAFLNEGGDEGDDGVGIGCELQRCTEQQRRCDVECTVTAAALHFDRGKCSLTFDRER